MGTHIFKIFSDLGSNWTFWTVWIFFFSKKLDYFICDSIISKKKKKKSGIYDEEYLDYIVEILKIAKSYGFSCFIDPHQDVWSRV